MNSTEQQALDRAGIIGDEFRETIVRDVNARVLLRDARDVVRLSGPTGTGKELVAGLIHDMAAARLGRPGPLLRASCSELSDEAFEGALFGQRDAGTARATGLVERAGGGTLVLDGVEHLGAGHQARLLELLGERRYRVPGDDAVLKTDALLILTTSQDPGQLVADGRVRRDLLDRAPAKIELPALYERRDDIRELTRHFAGEAARELTLPQFEGFTRRAHGDIENAVIGSRECSVRRLREIVRDVVFDAAAAGLLKDGDPITSDLVLGYLKAEFGYSDGDRETHDVAEVEARLSVQVQQDLLDELARRHAISRDSLGKLCEVLQEIVVTPDGRPKCYRNIVERSNRVMKVAFWLVSQARTQSEFRRYFGTKSFEMPAKSVAWQIYNEVFGRDE